MTVDSEIAQDCLLKSTLIGPGHTSVFREGSNRKFENQKGGCPPLQFWPMRTEGALATISTMT
jgi:hypothetical protein